MTDSSNSTSGRSKAFNFFFADYYRIAIIILTVLGILIVSAILTKTFLIKKKQKNKFKLVFIVMINVMITAVLETVSYSLNWIITDKNNKKTLLFGKSNEFFCQAQGFSLTFFQSSCEIFVTLISIITFISFKLEDDFNIDESKLSLIVISLIGYLIPLIESIIYLVNDGYGRSHSYCFSKIKTKKEDEKEIDPNDLKLSEICGAIHYSLLISLILISTFFISYLIISTTCRNKNINDVDLWIKDEYNKKYCIHPMLKKIIFFPIAQFFIMSVQFIYRYINYFSDYEIVEKFARPAAVVNSFSSIIYSLIFAISNGIFTNINEEVNEQNKIDSGFGGIELFANS